MPTANTTIGRAWNLLSINGGNCGKVGTTYMGTVGNPMNLINIIIAENERDSPFEPLSVRRGFKKNENIITCSTDGAFFPPRTGQTMSGEL